MKYSFWKRGLPAFCVPVTLLSAEMLTLFSFCNMSDRGLFFSFFTHQIIATLSGLTF